MAKFVIPGKELFILFLFLLFINQPFSQTNWERLYGLPDRGEKTYTVTRTYDNGFLYGILVQGQSPNQYGTWLLKTDLNGFPIWSKYYFNPAFSFIIAFIEEDENGDIIMTGDTREFDIAGDPMIMRLNSCGEKLWCKYMHFPASNFGWRVNHLPGRNYILLTWRASNIWLDEWIQLWGIDTSGNILFCKQIIPTYNYPNLLGPTPYGLYLTQDYGFLLSGYCYFPEDTTNPQGVSILQHLLIKTDSLGNEQWIIPDTLNMNHTGTLLSIIEFGEYYYVVGYKREVNPIWRPYFGKFTLNGHINYEYIMHSDTLFSIIFGIQKNNYNFIQYGQNFYSSNDSIYTGVFKTDTLGNIIIHFQNRNGSPAIGSFSNSINNKYLISGYSPCEYTSFSQLDAWAMKVNENLEYDTLYTYPFVYDSLCPFPIPTDTVDCDCDLITGFGEPVSITERYRVEVYPNPVIDRMQIRLNDLAEPGEKERKTVVLVDLFGRKIRELDFVTEATMEVKDMNPGLYLVVVEQRGMILARTKVVIL